MKSNICFGIVSWLPDNGQTRELRIARLNQLFKDMTNIFGLNLNLIVIAQNWQDYNPDLANFSSNIYYYDKLGILKARQTLRERFLDSNYEWLIMLDDDCIIKELVENGGKLYLDYIANHIPGFSVIKKNGEYKPAQLNLFAIHRDLISKEPLVPVDPEKLQCYEDAIYVEYLHCKYPELEFDTNYLIHTQLDSSNRGFPSTWSRGINWKILNYNLKYIKKEFKKGNFNFDTILANLKTGKEPEWSVNKFYLSTTHSFLP